MFVAKDKSGRVILYYKKPRRRNGYWLSVEGKYIIIDPTLVPNMSWEDEPLEVKLSWDKDVNEN